MTKDREALETALDALERMVPGEARDAAVARILKDGDVERALGRLRGGMADHRLPFEGVSGLDKAVRRLDQRTRQDGFRVLHTWDHVAHAFTKDTVPVLSLGYYRRLDPDAERGRFALQLFLDFYLVQLLTLCAMRAWDADDPDTTLDRIGTLLATLQSDGGSGHQFVADPETLIIYALSQFHPDEQAYDRAIERMQSLRPARQVSFAAASASVLSAHLRWGFWLMYGRDVVRMREDNVGDYPWLLSSVRTLAAEFGRLEEAGEEVPKELISALLQGLAADVWALTGKAPKALTEYADGHRELQDFFDRHGTALLEALEGHRPTKETYSPLAMHFNFPHNTFIALLILAALEGTPQELPLNALFAPSNGEDTEMVARRVMAFSRATDRLGAGGAVLVAYDPHSGMRSYSMTVDALRERIEG